MHIAARIAKQKDEHPENYCPMPKCLWRTEKGTSKTWPRTWHCEKHQHLPEYQRAMAARATQET